MSTLHILSAFELKKEDLKNVSVIGYKNMHIYLSKGQSLELSKSGKTFNIVQKDTNNNIIGKKNYRVSSCIFMQELFD